MKKSVLTLLFIVLFVSANAYAIDPEFRINYHTSNHQYEADIATNGTNYFVVWQSYLPGGSGTDIAGRLYDLDGNPISAEMQINTYTDHSNLDPKVTTDGTNYFVVWQSYQNAAGELYTLYGQFISNDGYPMVTNEFQISNREYSIYHDVASDGTNYLVTYAATTSSTTYVYSRRILSTGVVGSERVVFFNPDTCLGTYVASNGSNFMVAADYLVDIGNPAYKENTLYARQVQSSGIETGSIVQINSEHFADFYTPYTKAQTCDITADGSNYFATWTANDPGTAYSDRHYNIYGRLLDSNLNKIGPEVLINQTTLDSQLFPKACPLAGYGYCVVWHSNVSGSTEVFARPITSSGQPVGSEIQLNTESFDLQEYSAVAGTGNILFPVWRSYGQDGSGYGIYGAIFGDTDSDNDGLIYMYEWFNSLHPDDSDSDDDGLTDGAEVNTHGTNPLSDDTDSDSLRDAIEIYTTNTNPLLPDTDGDGLIDWEEIVLYRTDPIVEDSDNDGLIDSIEVWIYDTDPNNEDSDSDGFTDQEEVIAGTDPNDGLDFLAITIFEELSSHLGIEVIFIGWNSAPGKTYRVYVKTDMVSPKYIILEDNLESKGYQTFFMDQGGGPNNVPHPSMETGVRTYRVVVKP